MRTDKIFLDERRLVADKNADDLVAAYLTSRPQELYAALRDTGVPNFSSDLNEFITTTALPGAAATESIRRGQALFYEYAMEIMSLLGLYALPYCYAGSPGNKALYLSDRMRHVPGKRLHDTAAFVIGVCSPGTFEDGSATRLINRTRLIHAVARYHLLRGQWSMSWGAPINQEDMSGTNLAFSAIILFGLQRSGIVLNNTQKDDWIVLWRHIGQQLHIESELLPANFSEACRLFEVIKNRNIHKSAEGVELMQELISYYQSSMPIEYSRHVAGQIGFFLGEEVSACVGLAQPINGNPVFPLINSFRQLKSLLLPHDSSYQSVLVMIDEMRRKL